MQPPSCEKSVFNKTRPTFTCATHVVLSAKYYCTGSRSVVSTLSECLSLGELNRSKHVEQKPGKQYRAIHRLGSLSILFIPSTTCYVPRDHVLTKQEAVGVELRY